MKFTQSNASSRRNVIVLLIAQASLGSQMPMIFILGGLAGMSLAKNICFATMPITMIVLGSMLTAPVLSKIMQKYGRKIGFLLGALGGGSGASIGAVGLYYESFIIFLIGSLLTGIYMSAQGFYRFAAVDTASAAFRPKAISYVLAGGLLAALIGPQLVKLTAYAVAVPYLATYVFIIFLNFGGGIIFLFLSTPLPPKKEEIANGRSWLELLRDPKIAVSILCASIGYGLMNLVMTSTPLAIVGCGFNENVAANVVSTHVLAMFLPSFFTGHLISRFGEKRIILLGLLLLLLSTLIGLEGINVINFYGSLILLGVGWNFSFIGATTMLTQSYAFSERATVQGINDLIVFGSVTIASFGSGLLLNCSNHAVITGWTAINAVAIPFLGVATLALIFCPKFANQI